MGKRPAENTDPNDPLGILKKANTPTNVVSVSESDPLGILKKKEPGTNVSSISGRDTSPAANYRQSLKEYQAKSEEINNIQNDLYGLKSLIDKHDVLQADPAKLEEFKNLNKQYNSLVDVNNKKLEELKRIEVLLRQGKSAYDQDNEIRQRKLFKSLGLGKEETQQLRNQIFKQQYPDRAQEVDNGSFVPTYIDVDADDLAKSLTGSTLDQVALKAQLEKNRPISDRVFGTFKRSVEKTLAFELPASVGGAVSNMLSDVKIKDEDLNKSAFRPGIGHQIKKAINLIPGAKKAINEKVDNARVAALEFAIDIRNAPGYYAPGIGMLQNDQTLIKSISQIERPLDVIDFVFSNAGQGVAQILPSIATRGATSIIQEIGNNQIEGVIEIAKDLSVKEGRQVTPEEVIRKDLDEPATARTFGIIQGALDALGAGKVAKSMGYDVIKQDLKKRTTRWFEELAKSGGTEFITEGTQGALQQVSTGKMTGLGTIESVKRINWFNVLDESIAGFVGGTTVSGGGMLANEAASRIGLLKDIVSKPNKTEEEKQVVTDLLDIVVETAKKHGDPRPGAEIKRFIQNDVLSQVTVPKETPVAEDIEEASAEVMPAVEEPAEGTPEIIPAGATVELDPTPSTTVEEFSERNRVPVSTITPKERVIAEAIRRFPKESFERFGDPNFIKDTPAMRMFYLSKSGTPLDVQAQEMSYTFNPLGDGTDITTEDIVEFVKRFPQGKRQFMALDAEEAQVMAEQVLDEKPAEFFENKQGLRYALESIDKFGITPENIQSPEVQEYLNNEFLFDEADRENINAIFEYARTEEGLQKINSLLADINSEVSQSFGERPGLSEVQERAAEQEKVSAAGFPESWSQNQVENAQDPSLQANPPTDSDPVKEELKGYLGIINGIGPSLFDATESDQKLYREAQKKIEEAGYFVRNGELIKKDVPRVKKGATRPGTIKKSEKVQKEIDSLFDELNDLIGNSLSANINPQAAVVGAKIVAKYVELGVVRFAEIAADVYANYGEEAFRKYFQSLKAGYGSLLATSEDPNLTPLEDLRKAQVEDFTTNTQDNDTSTTGGLEPDSSRNQPADEVGTTDVQPERGTSGGSTGTGVQGVERSGNRTESDQRISDSVSPISGKQANTGVDRGKRSKPNPGQFTGSLFDTGGSGVDEVGLSSQSRADESAESTSGAQVASRLSFEEKVKLQERANRNVPIIPQDKDNIAASMPLLLPHQVENVWKAEKRFLNPPSTEDGTNKGILFTDGTGTGKTFTGLGIMKRYARMGVRDMLVVVPTDAKVKDWIDEGKYFGLGLYQLKDTKDAGREGTMVITTYANFRQNPALMARADKKPFGLVLYDESHKIVSNQFGQFTAADSFHKQLTNSPNQAWIKAKAKYQTMYDKAYDSETGSYEARQKVEELINAEAKRLVDATKVVFLSASPFSYHKNLEYADGYLFNIREGIRGADAGSSYNNFFVTNFGYRVRYSKLTEPDKAVDVGLMERAFHTRLTNAGAVSSTRLKLDKDYSREFVLIDDSAGMLIDEGIKIASDTNTFKYLPEVIQRKFTWLYRNQLLEGIKAKKSIDRIQRHLDLGRKVVVFHGFNNSLPSHPFDFSDPILYPAGVPVRLVQAEIDQFHSKYPQFKKLDMRDLKNPIKTLQEAFGDKVVLFNGNIPKKERSEVKRLFNRENSGKDIIVVQMEAGKEGISLHDTKGTTQRVMMNLGLPTKPTDAIQTEGRIYRIGQESDAIIEYPVLHLNFEKFTFANKINERVSTAENLAFGEQSRNLKEAFKEGYKAPITDDPHPGQGKGSRDSDMMFESIDEWEMSKTLYYSRQKRNAKTKAKEGTDYYATPEPLGLKMVEWLYPKENQKLLEPSAGHGAIARYFPENTINKYIEPSYNLKSDLAINTTGEILPGTFEDLHVGANKFDGIAMNPPFGTSGKTAMEHLVKAMAHLNNNGRVIAILPDGPSMQTRIDKWLSSEESENFFITAKISLPTVAFERAGTSVKSQILIIDKQIDPDTQKLLPQQRNIDLSHIDDINLLFERLKEMDMPERIQMKIDLNKAVVQSNQGGAPSEISQVIAGVHGKYGYNIWTVKLLKSIEAEDFQKANGRAQALDGYYSRYKGNNAIPGFIFKGDKGAENAQKLSDYINNGFNDGPINPSDPSGKSDSYNPMGAASRGRTTMAEMQGRYVTNQKGEQFKLYNKVKDLALKYNPKATIGQGHAGRGNLGIFYTLTRNIRINGLNSLSVAMHELVHALDARNSIIKTLMNTTKVGDKVRKRITDVYLKYYPKAKPSHDLRTRMVEGYAMLVQKFIEDPKAIQNDFPDLVSDFLTTGGKYWTDEVGLFVNDVKEIIAEYQMLDPLSKMGSRITNDVIDQPNKEFLTSADKVTQQIFDKLHPIEKLAKLEGTHFTQDDISLWMRLSNNVYQMAEKNISSRKQRFWAMDDKGEWSEKYNFNYFTLTKSLDKRGLQEEFAAYLFARRLKFEYDELKDLEGQLNNIMSPAYLQNIMTTMNVSIEAATDIVEAQARDIQKEMERLGNILENEGVSEEEANEAYNAGKDIFKNDEEIYDKLVAEDLEFAHNPNVQLLDDDGYNKFKARKGYATFKRAFYDELVGTEGVPAFTPTGKTKVSQFLTRRGSEKPILNPLMGAMMNHAEILRKGLKQLVYNKFLAVAEKHPDLFQIEQLQVNNDSVNRYPQEKDPNVLMARKDYKRVPIRVDNQIKAVIDENYDFHNAHLLERVGISMSQLFRTGTTGIFWQFFINNTFLDQMAATVNTRNGMWPFISSLRHIGPAALKMASEKIMGRAVLFPNSVEAAYLKEYLFLSGTSQTFLSADIQGVRGINDIIKGEDKGWIRKANNFFENILKILSTPGNATEIMTRGTEYILARKAGKPQVVALEEAGRVSAPFHHQGQLGGKIGQSYVRTVPYFNSSLQVLKQTQNTLRTREGQIRYAFTALSMIAASVGSTLYLLNQDDDDERKQLLKSLPPDNLTKYLFLPNPFTNKRLLQIRVPEQLGFLAGLFNMMLVESADQTHYKWSEYGEAAMSFAPTQLNPFNHTQMFFSYIPQAIKPSVEAITGVKVYPSVRPIETSRDKSNLPELRYNKYTSPGAIMLGEALGWSPKKIDNFLEGTFGRSVKYLTGKPGAYGVDNLFERELYLEASRQVQFYYDVKQRVAQQIKAIEDRRKEYSQEEINSIWRQDALVAEIEGLLEQYRDIEENPLYEVQAVYTRNLIFKTIKELEEEVY